MKLLSLLLCFCLSSNVLAGQDLSGGLEDAIDSYTYSITVEWDQKDAAFKQAKTNELLLTLLDLKEKDGLNDNEVISALEKRIRNPKVLEAIRLKASNLDGSLGPQSLVNLLYEESDLYSAGANWNGAAVAVYGGIAIVVIAMVSYSFWFEANYECTEWVSNSPHNRCVNYEKKN